MPLIGRKRRKPLPTTPTLVLHELGLLYIDIPKSGCSTVRSFLLDAVGDSSSKLHNIPSRRVTKETDVESLLIFTFFRDPVERLISCWRDKVRKPDLNNKYFVNGVAKSVQRFGFEPGQSFVSFVDRIAKIPDAEADHHFVSQVETLRPFYEASYSDRVNVWSFSDLEEKLQALYVAFVDARGPTPKVPQANRSLDAENVQRRPNLDSQTLEKIWTRYAADYDLMERLPHLKVSV